MSKSKLVTAIAQAMQAKPTHPGPLLATPKLQTTTDIDLAEVAYLRFLDTLKARRKGASKTVEALKADALVAYEAKVQAMVKDWPGVTASRLQVSDEEMDLRRWGQFVAIRPDALAWQLTDAEGKALGYLIAPFRPLPWKAPEVVAAEDAWAALDKRINDAQANKERFRVRLIEQRLALDPHGLEMLGYIDQMVESMLDDTGAAAAALKAAATEARLNPVKPRPDTLYIPPTI